ncbi:MAG: hypothetical protein RLZZ453_1308 [Chlamydiota bacterium]|jgi:hypothetical protein
MNKISANQELVLNTTTLSDENFSKERLANLLSRIVPPERFADLNRSERDVLSTDLESFSLQERAVLLIKINQMGLTGKEAIQRIHDFAQDLQGTERVNRIECIKEIFSHITPLHPFYKRPPIRGDVSTGNVSRNVSTGYDRFRHIYKDMIKVGLTESVSEEKSIVILGLGYLDIVFDSNGALYRHCPQLAELMRLFKRSTTRFLLVDHSPCVLEAAININQSQAQLGIKTAIEASLKRALGCWLKDSEDAALQRMCERHIRDFQGPLGALFMEDDPTYESLKLHQMQPTLADIGGELALQPRLPLPMRSADAIVATFSLMYAFADLVNRGASLKERIDLLCAWIDKLAPQGVLYIDQVAVVRILANSNKEFTDNCCSSEYLSEERLRFLMGEIRTKGMRVRIKKLEPTHAVYKKTAPHYEVPQAVIPLNCDESLITTNRVVAFRRVG